MSQRYSAGPEGKDLVIIATKEDHSTPSTVTLPELEPAPGLILPNGDINWNCPCLGGMATGPCGVPFREAFSCFHYSEAEPKGSDCYEAFSAMQECMIEYPTLYNKESNNSDEDPMKFDSIENDVPPSVSKPSHQPEAGDSKSMVTESKNDKS